jgi:alcohol dehydrogenase, propanol-preferring
MSFVGQFILIFQVHPPIACGMAPIPHTTESMKAMVIAGITGIFAGSRPLALVELAVPEPGDGEILIRVSACGVCHTELDEIEGRTPPPRFPVIPGHQVVGHVVKCGPNASRFLPGDRVGVGWIYSACGTCDFCRNGNENLCPSFQATGRDVNGGYAEFMTARQDFAHPVPEGFSDVKAAPLLCAGAIGYRSLRLANIQNGQSLGLTGFGASAHLVLKMLQYRFPSSRCYVFARSPAEQTFALEIGAVWAGDTEEAPPELLDAIIDTTPAWKPVVFALQHLKSGGRLVINAIRKETPDQDILTRLDYPRHLWMEKEIKSVANVARQDIRDFLEIASRIPIVPEIQVFSLESANDALIELKERNIRGAKVLVMRFSKHATMDSAL